MQSYLNYMYICGILQKVYSDSIIFVFFFRFSNARNVAQDRPILIILIAIIIAFLFYFNSLLVKHLLAPLRTEYWQHQ